MCFFLGSCRVEAEVWGGPGWAGGSSEGSSFSQHRALQDEEQDVSN